MSITLDGIELSDHLHWSDEFDWSPVQHETEYTLGGNLINEESVMLSGRPITLAGEQVWMPRSHIETLYALLQANKDMTLVLHDGRTFNVRWAFSAGPIKAKTVLPGLADPIADTPYMVQQLAFIATDPGGIDVGGGSEEASGTTYLTTSDGDIIEGSEGVPITITQ